jgi:hypothetical protein
MRGETFRVESPVRVAGLGWPPPRQRSGRRDASVGRGLQGIEAFVMHAEPARLRN